MMKVVADIDRINKENARRLAAIEKLVDAVSYNSAHTGAGAIKSIAESRVSIESELASSKKEIANQQQARYNDILKLVKENEKQIKLLREEQVNRLEFLFNSHLNFKTSLLEELAETRAANEGLLRSERDEALSRLAEVETTVKSLSDALTGEGDHRARSLMTTVLGIQSTVGEQVEAFRTAIENQRFVDQGEASDRFARLGEAVESLHGRVSSQGDLLWTAMAGLENSLVGEVKAVRADADTARRADGEVLRAAFEGVLGQIPAQIATSLENADVVVKLQSGVGSVQGGLAALEEALSREAAAHRADVGAVQGGLAALEEALSREAAAHRADVDAVRGGLAALETGLSGSHSQLEEALSRDAATRRSEVDAIQAGLSTLEDRLAETRSQTAEAVSLATAKLRQEISGLLDAGERRGSDAVAELRSHVEATGRQLQDGIAALERASGQVPVQLRASVEGAEAIAKLLADVGSVQGGLTALAGELTATRTKMVETVSLEVSKLRQEIEKTHAADREDNATKFTAISGVLQSLRDSEADRNYLFTRTYFDFKSQLGREFTEAKASIGRGWLEKFDKGLGQIAEVKTSIAALTDARSRDFSFVTKQQLGIQEMLTASTSTIQANLERLESNVEGTSKPVLDKLEAVGASIGRLGGEHREIIKINKEIYEKILRTDDMRDIDTKLGLRDYKLKRIPKLHDVLNNFPQVVQDGKPFRFWDYDVEYVDRKALWIQINELLLREEYYFSDDREAAHRIIDCGANIGLAVLFFKSLYPNSKIIGFEPNKECFKVAQSNIKRNNLKDVVMLNAAVSDKEGRQKLFIDEKDSMASSLAKRDTHGGPEAGNAVTVKAVKLSSYLDEKVDLLKLDIEGSEAIVLKEVGSKLKSVKYLFCEYHFDEGNQENSLRDIIDILDDQKFDYQIAKSVWYSEHSEYRPFNFVGKRYSGIIYARNREFVVE